MNRLLAFLVGGLLAVSGSLKLADPGTFALAIANYHLMPRQALQPLAYLLPPLELLVAAGLLHPHYRRAAWAMAAGLFSLFAMAVGSALVRGLDVSCGCFGGSSRVSWAHLGGNAVLALLCWQQVRQRRESWLEPGAILLAAASCLACLHHASVGDRPLFAAPRNPGYDSLITVGLEEVQQTLGHPGQLLVDVRSAQAYRRGSLPGAVSVPLHSRLSSEQEQQLRAAERILLFCGNRGCNSSKEQAVFLLSRGFGPVAVFPGGVREWREAGLDLLPEGSSQAPLETP